MTAMASRIIMNRAQRGIYAGRHIRYGNQVSEDGGNKTRRSWKPNVQKKRLFSLMLDRHIRVAVTTHALRCIDKKGGIDEYLLGIPEKKLDSQKAVFWRRQIAAAAFNKVGGKIESRVPAGLKRLEEELRKVKLDAEAGASKGASHVVQEAVKSKG